MTTLKNWTARRSGGRITVNGLDPVSAQPIKVPNIDTIILDEGKVIATNKDGARFHLLA